MIKDGLVTLHYKGVNNLNSTILNEGIERVVVEERFKPLVDIKDFENTNIKYMRKETLKDGSDVYIFESEADVSSDEVIEIKKYQDMFLTDSLSLYYFLSSDIRNLKKILNILDKNKVPMPEYFAKKLSPNFEGFVYYNNVRFFKNEVLSLPQLQFVYENNYNISYDEEYLLSNLYLLAYGLGCFSNEKIVNKKGEVTNVTVGQKASSLLANLIKSEAISLEYLGSLVRPSILPTPNAKLIKFFSVINENKEYENINIVKNLALEYKNIAVFWNVVNKFDEIAKLRVGLNKNGMPIKYSWEECIRKHCFLKTYENVNQDNQQLAKEFVVKGISSSGFKKADEVFKLAKAYGTKEHILQVHLKEKTLLEEIEELKREIGLELNECKKLMGKTLDKFYTYEFLSKKDPKNAIIGLYASCCATIEYSDYGKYIAKATILSNDVQNIVVRDINGDIIAKGALYVNKELAYGVINDFEINERYKKHEVHGEPGVYDVSRKSEEEQERQKIFDCFMRAIKDFVREYDRENPSNPIHKINVGMGYNRLKRQVKEFPREYDMLYVPPEHDFQDAHHGQRILYERNSLSKQMKKYFLDKENENAR